MDGHGHMKAYLAQGSGPSAWKRFRTPSVNIEDIGIAAIESRSRCAIGLGATVEMVQEEARVWGSRWTSTIRTSLRQSSTYPSIACSPTTSLTRHRVYRP